MYNKYLFEKILKNIILPAKTVIKIQLTPITFDSRKKGVRDKVSLIHAYFESTCLPE